MDEPLTEELLNELLDTHDVESYLDEHALGSRNLCAYLNELLQTHGLVRKDVVKAACIDATYGYMLFVGSRTNPSRNIVLPIALAMGLGVRETNRLLQAAGLSGLYAKNRRDAIIIYCIEHGLGLQETNDYLHRLGEETL